MYLLPISRILHRPIAFKIGSNKITNSKKNEIKHTHTHSRREFEPVCLLWLRLQLRHYFLFLLLCARATFSFANTVSMSAALCRRYVMSQMQHKKKTLAHIILKIKIYSFWFNFIFRSIAQNSAPLLRRFRLLFFLVSASSKCNVWCSVQIQMCCCFRYFSFNSFFHRRLFCRFEIFCKFMRVTSITTIIITSCGTCDFVFCKETIKRPRFHARHSQSLKKSSDEN